MPKNEGGATAKVERKKAKQEELPTITVSDRRIAELEDLGDRLADLEDEASSLREKIKDANEDLVVAMKKRERTFYQRPAWGTIILSESAVRAKVKKGSAGSSDSEEE